MSDNNEATSGLPMFTGAPMHDYFCQMADLGPSVTMAPSATPVEWSDGEPFNLPETYGFDGESRSVEGFLTETDTAALLVLQDGKVRHEHYALTGGRDTPWISFSVAKSFISVLVGIAADEGSIRSLDDAMSDYFDVASGSAYDGCVGPRRVADVIGGAVERELQRS